MLATIALTSLLLNGPSNDKPAIEKACAAIAKASETKNWPVLTSLCTPDFRQHTLQGQTIKLKDLQANLNGIQNLKLTFKVMDVKSDGKVAKCRVFWSVKGTFEQQGHHTFQGDDIELDTFKKVNGKWLEASVTELSASQKIDGKAQQTTGVRA